MLRCKGCGASLDVDAEARKTGYARCGYCSSLVDVDQAAGTASGRPRLELPLPEKFTLTDDGGRLTIRRRWFTAVAFFLVFFCIFWDGFMVVWFGIAFREGVYLMAAFGTLHGAVGVGLTYFTICLFVNHTTIEVTPQELRIRHAPLPWPGAGVHAADRIRQLFCVEKVSQGKNGTSRTYEVHAIFDDERRQKILSGLFEPEHAIFLEQSIERFLGIRDRPVTGAFTG
jgi:hypothetical protein